MDRQYIQDYQVVERYLGGKLTTEEEQAFEEAYLADPELLDEVQLVERLEQGVKDLGARGDIRHARAFGRWLDAFSTSQYAAAASVLLAASLVLSGVLYVQNVELRQAQGPLVATATDVVPLIPMRGGDAIEIVAPGQNELKVLWVDTGSDEYDSYGIVVARRTEQGAQEITQVGGLMPGFQSQLTIVMPGRLLTPGDYEVEVDGRMSNWPTERASEPITGMVLRVIARE